MFSTTPRILVPLTAGARTGCLSSHKDQGTGAIKKNHQVTTPWVGTPCSGRKSRHQQDSRENNTACSLFDGRSLCSSSISAPAPFPSVLFISMLLFPPLLSVHRRGSLWCVKRSEFWPERTGCARRHLKDRQWESFLSFPLWRQLGLSSPPNVYTCLFVFIHEPVKRSAYKTSYSWHNKGFLWLFFEALRIKGFLGGGNLKSCHHSSSRVHWNKLIYNPPKKRKKEKGCDRPRRASDIKSAGAKR